MHKGKRRWLDEKIFEGETDDVLTYHRYFRDYRDKHTEHSVDTFEIHATGIHVTDHDGDDPHVEGAVTLFATRGNETTPSRRITRVVGNLCPERVAWEKHKEGGEKQGS